MIVEVWQIKDFLLLKAFVFDKVVVCIEILYKVFEIIHSQLLAKSLLKHNNLDLSFPLLYLFMLSPDYLGQWLVRTQSLGSMGGLCMLKVSSMRCEIPPRFYILHYYK